MAVGGSHESGHPMIPTERQEVEALAALIAKEPHDTTCDGYSLCECTRERRIAEKWAASLRGVRMPGSPYLAICDCCGRPEIQCDGSWRQASTRGAPPSATVGPWQLSYYDPYWRVWRYNEEKFYDFWYKTEALAHLCKLKRSLE